MYYIRKVAIRNYYIRKVFTMKLILNETLYVLRVSFPENFLDVTL